MIAIIIVSSFLPIIVYLALDFIKRPREYARGFKKRFCTTWIEYLPDPSWMDDSRKLNTKAMEAKVNQDIRISEMERKNQ